MLLSDRTIGEQHLEFEVLLSTFHFATTRTGTSTKCRTS